MPEDYFDFYNQNRGTTNPYSAFGGTGNTSSTTSTGYTPPSQGTQQAQNQTSNMDASDWWDAARFVYGVYRDRNPPKPEFENVPLSPEQKQMYQIYMASLLNPATVNNASALNQMATQMLGGMSNMRWQSPQTFSGQQGYSGSSMAFTPPQVQPGSSTWPGGGTPSGPPATGGRPDPGGVGRMPDFPGPRPNTDPMGPPTKTASGSPLDFFEKFAGKWNGEDEPWEKYIARAAAIAAAAFGLPIPPALIDKGIDLAQWIYRTVTGKQAESPMDRFYGDPGGGIGGPGQSPGAQFGSAYGPGERPPGFGGTPPAPGVGMTGGSRTGYEGFGTGFGQFGNGPTNYPSGPPGMFNPAPPAPGVGMTGGTTGFEGFGAPGSVRPAPPPPPRPAPWTGSSTPTWQSPSGAYNPSDPNETYRDVPWNPFGN